MAITLRVFLIILSLLSCFLCIKRIKQAKLKVENSIIWLIGSIILILMSIFDQAVTWVSVKIGFVSPANFVFLVVMIFLLIETFVNNIRISNLNEKIKELNHYIAIKEYNDKQSGGKENNEK